MKDNPISKRVKRLERDVENLRDQLEELSEDDDNAEDDDEEG